MRVRPVAVFATVAAFMVAWLFLRMCCGSVTAVWCASCVLGAWAPLAAAATFAYVRAVGDREDTVLVAWLVRAIGMHFVLVWMLGASDWLRGPPGRPSGWNADLGAPVVLLSFVPAFAAGFGAIAWATSLARRLAGVVLRPALPGESTTGARPAFRGVALASAGAPTARAPVAPLLVAAVGAAALCARAATPMLLLAAAVPALALCAVRNHRALAPGLAASAGLAVLALVRNGSASAVDLGVAVPWTLLAVVAGYLAAIEGALRTRRVAPG